MRTLIPARYAGLLRFPSACREGERIRIVSGPLKDVGGKIRRIDVRYLWSLTTPPSPPEPGFELIDSVDGSGGSVVIIVSGQLNSQLTGN